MDPSGNFRFPQLAIVDYEIVVSQGEQLIDTKAIRVTIGGIANATFELSSGQNFEPISVVASRISAVDLSASDSGLNIAEAEFDCLPVGRNITSIALLAAGAVKEDSRFGNGASFFGSSVA